MSRLSSTNRRLWHATGQFAHDLADWQWWATLTFKRVVAGEVGERAFRTWAREIARVRARDHVRMAYAWELSSGGTLAYHALLDPPEGTFNGPIGHDIWQRVHPATGFTRIVRFEGSGGAAWYQADHVQWDINVACPRTSPACRRASGCIEAPGPW